MKVRIPKTMTVAEALTWIAPTSSKRSRQQWVQHGRVWVDGKPIFSLTLQLPEGVELSLEKKRAVLSGGIKKVYEDRHLVVIDKPAGLLSVSTAFEKEETAHNLLKQEYHPGRIYVVHRIDQETSGLLLFARTPSARDELKKLLEHHEITREYIAIVEGHPSTSQGTWMDYQQEDGSYIVHSSQNPRLGKKAITHFRLLHKTKQWAALSLHLETGRKNQIRVHCQQAGCPIVGDAKYGSTKDPMERLALHAWKLVFVHPVTGKNVLLISPLPPPFYKLIPSLTTLYRSKRGGHASR